jgi:hypothetical protein
MRLSATTGTRLKTAAVVAVVIACTAIAAWFGITDRNDPKGPRYILWKYGIFSFDPTVTYQAMVGDREREKLAVGLTVPELKHRFGNLRTRAESTADYQKYYSDRFFLDQEILWLGDSAWLVVVKDGRVQQLHLMKG